MESMYEHPCRATLPIWASHSDGDEAFADLCDHLVVGDADMEMLLGGFLLIKMRLADFWSCDDSGHIRIDHKIIFLDRIDAVSDDNFDMTITESGSELILDIIDSDEISIA